MLIGFVVDVRLALRAFFEVCVKFKIFVGFEICVNFIVGFIFAVGLVSCL